MAKVDLKMMAAHLGFSVSTISKALRDSHEIGEKTKQIILDKARELGYRPNPYASYMRHQKSKTIALILPEMNNSFFLQVINGAESIAREKDYHLLIYITHEDAEQEKNMIEHLQNGRVDGIIMAITLNTTSYDHLETVKIVTDDFASAFTATEHLIQNGCKSIGYLSVSDNLSIGTKRMSGYIEALHKYDIPVDESKIIHCVADQKENYQMLKDLLVKNPEIDGIFGSVERFALLAYDVCKELKKRIPEDVKVLCYSNLPAANFLSPTLTTIHQPASEMGATAAATLFKHLDKKRSTITNENITIKSTLMIRESSTVRNEL